MSDNSDDLPRMRWGCILFVLLAVPASYFVIFIGWPFIDRTTAEEAKAKFTVETGLAWPESAKIVSFGDDHGIVNMSSEGEFHIVFDTDQRTIDKFLNSELKAPAPDEQFSEWKSGPVDPKISPYCGFDTMATYSTHARSTLSRQEIDDALDSKNIMYTASERCCDNIEWHNGTLLIVDPVNNRVWLSSWDY